LAASSRRGNVSERHKIGDSNPYSSLLGHPSPYTGDGTDRAASLFQLDSHRDELGRAAEKNNQAEDGKSDYYRIADPSEYRQVTK
jgi:hypothetical protein